MTRSTALRPPWITHVAAMLVLAAWWYADTVGRYGVSTKNGLWISGHETFAVELVLVALVPGAVLAWFEAWSVQVGVRWGAHLLAVCYVLLAGVLAHVPAFLRFWGDAGPTPLADLVLAWIAYPVMVGLQLLLAWWMTRWPFPTVRRGLGRRLARALGLVE